MEDMTLYSKLDNSMLFDKDTCDYRIYQRGPNNTADIALSGKSIVSGHFGKEFDCRLAYENSGAPVPGFEKVKIKTDEEGKWAVTLKDVPAGGLYRFEIYIEYEDGISTVHDIGVGDIWMITGQSNAGGTSSGYIDDPQALGVHKYCTGGYWTVASHPLGNGFGHSPFIHFAKLLQRELNVPIGLLPVAIGGSSLEQWYRPDRDAQFFKRMSKHLANAGGKVRGMIWYQGETDAMTPGRPEIYAERFTAFIEKVRTDYGMADLPVITTQLNKYTAMPAEFVEGWSVICEIERKLQYSIDNLAVVVTSDLTLADAIHTSASGNMVLAERYFNTAMGLVYGKNLNWKAPDIISAVKAGDTGNEIILTFANTPLGLTLFSEKETDFIVKDTDGNVAIKSAKVLTRNTIRLLLERPLAGAGTVSSGVGGNFTPMLYRLPDIMPALKFYELEIK